MACACGSKGSSVKRQTFVVTFSDGTSKSYASEVEAQSAIARRGGGTYKIKA
jgi:hypothetical protein